MEKNVRSIVLEKNPVISIGVTSGHFTTGNVHTNCYLDVSKLKTNALLARDVARELAVPYLSNTLVDTIVCMENTQTIGAYLAEELLQDGTSVINSGGEIHVVTPLTSTDRKLIFYDSEVEWIANRNILLLIATISSGQTLSRALECLTYYQGRVAGILSLFMVSPGQPGHKIHTLFTSDDIPGYKVYGVGACDMCKAGHKLDALISSEGYTKI